MQYWSRWGVRINPRRPKFGRQSRHRWTEDPLYEWWELFLQLWAYQTNSCTGKVKTTQMTKSPDTIDLMQTEQYTQDRQRDTVFGQWRTVNVPLRFQAAWKRCQYERFVHMKPLLETAQLLIFKCCIIYRKQCKFKTGCRPEAAHLNAMHLTNTHTHTNRCSTPRSDRKGLISLAMTAADVVNTWPRVSPGEHTVTYVTSGPYPA